MLCVLTFVYFNQILPLCLVFLINDEYDYDDDVFVFVFVFVFGMAFVTALPKQ